MAVLADQLLPGELGSGSDWRFSLVPTTWLAGFVLLDVVFFTRTSSAVCVFGTGAAGTSGVAEDLFSLVVVEKIRSRY